MRPRVSFSHEPDIHSGRGDWPIGGREVRGDPWDDCWRGLGLETAAEQESEKADDEYLVHHRYHAKRMMLLSVSLKVKSYATVKISPALKSMSPL